MARKKDKPAVIVPTFEAVILPPFEAPPVEAAPPVAEPPSSPAPKCGHRVEIAGCLDCFDARNARLIAPHVPAVADLSAYLAPPEVPATPPPPAPWAGGEFFLRSASRPEWNVRGRGADPGAALKAERERLTSLYGPAPADLIAGTQRD